MESLAPAYGFPLAGALDLQLALPALEAHAERFRRWLADGRHDRMAYLARAPERRADPRLLFPDAKGIFCVAAPYGPVADQKDGAPAAGAEYALYLRGRDYHEAMTEKLEALLRAASRTVPFKYKICCDTSAVLERSLAHIAGLGFIGKNTCLIHPKFGSYLFLAEAFLDVSPSGAPAPMRDHCGKCERCLAACPTRALAEPHGLDARRCVSAWTLERRGALDLSDADLSALGRRVAGCDACQSVCPFNRKPRPAIWPEFADYGLDATATADWVSLLSEGEEEYRIRVRHSALSRVKPAQFRRNLALALASCAGEFAPSAKQDLRALAVEKMKSETDAAALEAFRRCVAVLDRLG